MGKNLRKNSFEGKIFVQDFFSFFFFNFFFKCTTEREREQSEERPSGLQTIVLKNKVSKKGFEFFFKHFFFKVFMFFRERS